MRPGQGGCVETFACWFLDSLLESEQLSHRAMHGGELTDTANCRRALRA